jgi:ubiquinone/menaquinone biosynthesis C-methylase UbiE
LFNKIGLEKNKNVVCVGCRTGNGIESIYSKIGPNRKILCLDISNQQIEEAKKKLKSIESISYKVEDIQRADFESQNPDECGKYDVVYCRFVLIYLQNPLQALKNMLSMLKPNGIIACEESYDCKTVLQNEEQQE